MSSTGRILIASDNVADADLVRELLPAEFDDVVRLTEPDDAVADFENARPDVLILAFNPLEKAERYYVNLYRQSTVVHGLPHGSVILCNNADRRRAYELCRKQYFDDYVLFWPMTHDALRLPMAVHHALRQLSAVRAGAPTVSEFALQARRLIAAGSLLEQHAVRGGARIDVASSSIQRTQQDIGLALDAFSHQLSQGDLHGMVEVKDAPGFQREIDRLKEGEIAPRLKAVTAAVQPVLDWAGALKAEVMRQTEPARALQTLVERVCPLVLVVEDDAFQRKVLLGLLRDENLELAFATSGCEALAMLRRCCPDLILMDVELPDVDGIEATRRIKSLDQFAGISVLMITGHSNRDAVVRSMEAGAAGFVVKPFKKEALLGKIRNCLNRVTV